MKQRNNQYQGEEQAKYRWLWIVPLIALLVVVGGWREYTRPADLSALYALAVTDAVTAEQSEIKPLVELSRDSPLTTWDQQGRVLLLSWHRHPERYIEGKEMILSSGSVWTFTEKEIAAWYERNKADITDWDLRLEQLIGLPPAAEYTHMSGFWVTPTNVVRPAYVTDPTAQMQLSFPAETAPEFKEWFEENSKFSYRESAYPWTRLGYTYDWADNGEEYGLTEFLIEENATVKVAFTMTTAEFLALLENGARVGGAN